MIRRLCVIGLTLLPGLALGNDANWLDDWLTPARVNEDIDDSTPFWGALSVGSAATRCDELAGDPFDPDARGSVSVDDFLDGLIDPYAAFEACFDAVAQADTIEPRHVYQLGRMQDLLEDESYLASYQTAAEFGYAQAAYVLAVIHLEDPENSDPPTALAFAEHADALGHPNAVELIHHLKTSRFSVEGYHNPELLLALYHGRLDEIPDNVVTRSVVASLYNSITSICTKFEVDHTDVGTKTLFTGFLLPIRRSNMMQTLGELPETADIARSGIGELKQSIESRDVGSAVTQAVDLFLRGKLVVNSTLAIYDPNGFQDGKWFYENHRCHTPEASKVLASIFTLIRNRSGQVPDEIDWAATSILVTVSDERLLAP